MALRLVQEGKGDPRPLVLGFLLGSDQDMYLPITIGERACLILDDSATGPAMPQLLEFAYKQANLRSVSELALIGYSAGCRRVRELRLAGANASAYILVDGTHASMPPQQWQIDWLRDLANQARQGRILLVASHTQQTYCEELANGQAYASTWRVLQMATGWSLDKGGTIENPAVTRQGELWVYSYASAKIDAAAHTAQYSQVAVFSSAHLGPWLERPRTVPAPSGQAAYGEDASLPLGLLGVAAVMAMGTGKV
jgi:hypothetical protein